MERGEIKQKVTSDYILDLYEKAKKIKSRTAKAKMMKNIKVLSQNLGKYLVRPLD